VDVTVIVTLSSLTSL